MISGWISRLYNPRVILPELFSFFFGTFEANGHPVTFFKKVVIQVIFHCKTFICPEFLTFISWRVETRRLKKDLRKYV